MGALRAPWLLALALAVAGCGGGSASPRLADGSEPPAVPADLAGLADVVATRSKALPVAEVGQDRLSACGLRPASAATTAVERVGLHGSSLTFRGPGSTLHACDAIPESVADPDQPYAGRWCASAVGRLEESRLSDPRLDLCESADGRLTAFAWVVPHERARWVLVEGEGRREAYEALGSLPVRVAAVERVYPEGRASLAIEEYAKDGRRLRAYVLDVGVAG